MSKVHDMNINIAEVRKIMWGLTLQDLKQALNHLIVTNECKNKDKLQQHYLTFNS